MLLALGARWRSGRKLAPAEESVAQLTTQWSRFCDHSANGMQELVWHVQRTQALLQEHRDRWHKLCDLEGRPRDPLRSEAGLLIRFWAECWARPPPSSRRVDGRLVETVKQAQRSSLNYTRRWHQFCKETCGGVCDPAMLDSSALSKFLESLPPGSWSWAGSSSCAP